MSNELIRLSEDASRTRNWKRWGPYLAERQWATVREDYSPNGTCWEYFPHDHSRSRAYRWGEDGLLGFTDRECRLCFSVALWNTRDPILKERLFGLTGPEGNHGEDVKEEYFYLDSTPTHSYCKALYKYPQREFPYSQLVEENRRRGRNEPEFELRDTGVFGENRYFDVFAEYGKGSPDDILIRITVANRGPDLASLHLLPTLWFRNTWSWGCNHEGCTVPPALALDGPTGVKANHPTLGAYRWVAGPGPDGSSPAFLFTENETNGKRISGTEQGGTYVKDAFHEYVVGGDTASVNPAQTGTKAAAHYRLEVAAGESVTVCLRLTAEGEVSEAPLGEGFATVFERCREEADAFYAQLAPEVKGEEERRIHRQGYAGLLWTKQFYHLVTKDWLEGDPDLPAPPAARRKGRNHEWGHLFARDVLSMPDKWEYPWFAAWDLAFHMIPFARIDPEAAKRQLTLMLREWYMHPNGQIPAYEFAFGDVNPPVHAWAAWRVYKVSAAAGKRDREFLESVFQKLLLNFTWWVNRKDAEGRNLFSGGFLGLDNIGVFDRSQPLPTGGTLQQADGTAWMAFFCGTMLSMALELARDGDKVNRAYEDMASKFLEHFVQIVDAMNHLGDNGLWDEADGFYYDQIRTEEQVIPLKTRSLVGLLPLIAVEVLEEDRLRALPGFYKRLQWFLNNRKDLEQHATYCHLNHHGQRRLLAVPSKERLQRLLQRLVDENEFLSPYGVRSLSKFHEKNPYRFEVNGTTYGVEYTPGESTTGLFGGNSNWRGPIWFPVNYLLIEALGRYHHFYGDSLKVECPAGSGRHLNLVEVGREISARLVRLFKPDASGVRPCHGEAGECNDDPHWRELVLFHEYFHADTGRGLGASHQTGWTALVVRLIENLAHDAPGGGPGGV